MKIKKIHVLFCVFFPPKEWGITEEILGEIKGMFSGQCTCHLVNPDPSSPTLMKVNTSCAA